MAEIVRHSLGQHAGRLRADPEILASVVMAAVDGLALQWLLSPDDVPSGEQLAAALADAIGFAASP